MREHLVTTLVDFQSFLSYLRRPVLLRAQKDLPLLTMFRFCVIGLALAMTAGLLTRLLIDAGLIPDPGRHTIEDEGGWLLFFSAVIIAPPLEEIAFRMQLKSFSGSLFFTLFVLGIVLVWLLPSNPYPIALAIIALLGTYFGIIHHFGQSMGRKYRFWKLVFPVNFYLTAAAFSFIHLVNFSRAESLIHIGLLYTVPQLILGLILGYVRLKHNLKFAIMLHALFNATLLLIQAVWHFLSNI